jgi:hypothetical protein
MYETINEKPQNRILPPSPEAVIQNPQGENMNTIPAAKRKE